ncbi:major facilitator superfamily domain-containing protein [Durotheca rogersii]|uniref:major facilitator superfamily domain-containing protein n=1 Tax=Durotheca rogersii TaxID=419775 RepID=UPI002220A159|nr:major facilitator superfamily domain-containing protein [Durotheca rogersii]KAI5865874.1 major facilitator superfamily domain-containing protein [Durotheca rogersii]
MISSFGVEKKEVAKWAGITSSVFSLAQSLTAVAWGRASDRLGRKPVIMTGLLCTMICFLAWGMSTSLSMAIIVRAIQGASNGNVGIIRTMVAEMVTERELQPKAFSVMPLVWSVGSVFGPAFGGMFAKPAENWPGLFGNSEFFKKYPFAFPNIIGSLFFLISLATGVLFLKETLHRKRHARDWGLVLGERIAEVFREKPHRGAQRLRRYSLQDAEASAPLLTAGAPPKSAARVAVVETPIEKAKPLPMSAVFTRQSVVNLVAYTFLALHSVAFDQVLAVFLNYPPQEHTPENTSLPFVFSGGFGLTHARIGSIFAFYGIVSGLIQFLLFPPLCARFGVLRCFQACLVTFPVVYAATPYTVLLGGAGARLAALAAVLVVKSFAVIVGFPCTTILLTNSAASLDVLGTLNGFATTFSALGRAGGPALAGAAFTWGVKHDVVGLPWWLLAAISALGAVPAWFIVEGDGPRGAAEDDEAEDENLDEFQDELDAADDADDESDDLSEAEDEDEDGARRRGALGDADGVIEGVRPPRRAGSGSAGGSSSPGKSAKKRGGSASTQYGTIGKTR